ncbi:MAG TPA: RNA polymerase sigma-70 factor [Sunxiuqinia sp.]|nr:RNA polymerase sigma-70 factor [Sunxiuqinia sp.]
MDEREKYLFDKIRSGDEAAFKVIYNQYVSRLYYFIYEYISHADIVENIIQETLMVLWDKRQELRDDTNLGAYLFTVAKNNCLYKLRDQRYKQTLFHAGDFDEQELKINLDALGMLDTSNLIFEEIEQIIEETLNELPPQCRIIFKMSRFKNKKNKEIATELGISVKAVEGQMTKALKIFRKALKDYLPLLTFLFMN